MRQNKNYNHTYDLPVSYNTQDNSIKKMKGKKKPTTSHYSYISYDNETYSSTMNIPRPKLQKMTNVP